jgi:hypothetical protein
MPRRGAGIRLRFGPGFTDLPRCGHYRVVTAGCGRPYTRWTRHEAFHSASSASARLRPMGRRGGARPSWARAFRAAGESTDGRAAFQIRRRSCTRTTGCTPLRSSRWGERIRRRVPSCRRSHRTRTRCSCSVLRSHPPAKSYPVVNTGLTYNARPPQGRAAICLTATQVVLPLLPDQFSAVNRIDGPSIDYVIAHTLQTPPLLLGIHPVGGNAPSDITFDTNGMPQPRLTAPTEILSSVFGPVIAPPTAPDTTALQKQKAITDFLNSSFATLRPHLSAYDRAVLDRHLTACSSTSPRIARAC